MATPVILPKQGNSVESCIIQQWRKQPGDTVAEGEILLDVETDKAVVEVPSPAAGTLLATFFKAGDDVPVMTTIAALGASGEDASALAPKTEAAPTAAAPAAVATGALAPVVVAAAPVAAVSGAGSSPRARALAAATGLDAEALAGSGPSGLVIERDVSAASAGRCPLSSQARERLAAGGLEAPARGSGPGGLVLAGDLVPAKPKAAAPAPVAAAVSAGPVVIPAPVVQGAFKDTPLSKIRTVIAERMRQSLTRHAQYTLTAPCRAEALQRLRARFKADPGLGLGEVTVGDLIAVAAARTLLKFPDLNAHFLGDRVRTYAEVHLGLAVDTPRGLMVPVVTQAHALSLAAFSAAFKPLAKACQEGKVDPARLQGSTFTISNLGALGIEAFTPVLNSPEVAILGVGGIHLRPYDEKGQVVFKPTLMLSLTCDHQAVDGAPGARFLQALVQQIESVETLLAN